MNLRRAIQANDAVDTGMQPLIEPIENCKFSIGNFQFLLSDGDPGDQTHHGAAPL